MKKKLIAIIFSCLLIFSLTACSEPVQVNVSNNQNISSNQLGVFAKISDNFVYDSATRIVYFNNHTYCGYSVYVPYYAPNGLPYKYNPETNTFEEINK